MKKIIGFVLTLFTVATLFAAARPSLDGRALVADAGSMPKGLFARTIGYLPGDSVSVTNPATGSTVDVLILGAIDPSEGVAILLSPEAANKLSITRDSNVQVKITKRAGSLDETASGAAVVSESSEAYTAHTETAAENPVESIGEKSEAADNPVTMKSLLDEGESSPAVAEVPEDPVSPEEALAEKETFGEESLSPSEPVVVVTIPEEVPAEEKPESVIEPVPEVVAEESTEEPELFDPLAEENTAKAEGEGVDRIVFIDAPGEPATDESPAEEAELEDLASMVKASEEEAEEEKDEVVAEYVDETAPEYTEPLPSEKVVLEEVPESETAEAEKDAEESTDVAKSAEKSGEVAEDGAYQPIVLVPAGENPPAAEEKPAENLEAVTAKAVSETTETQSLSQSQVAESTQTAESAAAPAVKTISAADFMLPSLKSLESGKYYVQIASLGALENVDGLLAKYSEKYPMVVVPLTSGKAYQVMVGPLTSDEYTVVQEKFRAFGFKDAFLRKIR